MAGRLNETRTSVLEDWYRDFAPARITIHTVETGAQIQELSLVAVQIRSVEQAEERLETGERITVSRMAMGKCVAVGQSARKFEYAKDTVVFSPLRDGQIAHYDAARYLFQTLLKQACPRSLIRKPVLFIRIPERTTQVEERAMADVGIQAGARQVLMYRQPLSVLLNTASERKALRHAIVFHIEPQDENRAGEKV